MKNRNIWGWILILVFAAHIINLVYTLVKEHRLDTSSLLFSVVLLLLAASSFYNSKRRQSGK